MRRETDMERALRERIEAAGLTVATPNETAYRLFGQLELHHLADHISEGGFVLDRAVMRAARQVEESGATAVSVQLDYLLSDLCAATPSDHRMVARQLANRLMQERFERHGGRD